MIPKSGYRFSEKIMLKELDRSNAELGAGDQHVAGELAGTGGEFVTQTARGGGIAFEHALKQAARHPDDRAMIKRDRTRRPLHRDDQRQFADQGTGARNDLGAAVLDADRTTLNDIAGI